MAIRSPGPLPGPSRVVRLPCTRDCRNPDFSITGTVPYIHTDKYIQLLVLSDNREKISTNVIIIHTYIQTNKHSDIHVLPHTFNHVCIYAWINVCMYVCMIYVFKTLSICMCMHLFIYLFIYISIYVCMYASMKCMYV